MSLSSSNSSADPLFVSNRGAKKTSSVYEYFKISEDQLSFECCVQIDGDICGKRISASKGRGTRAPNRVSNMKRHLQRHHPHVLLTIYDKEVQRNIEKQNCKPQPKKCNDVVRVTVSMNAEKFKKCIRDMVNEHALPYNLFTSPSFSALFGEMASKLHVSLEMDSIQNIVTPHAELEPNLQDINAIFIQEERIIKREIEFESNSSSDIFKTVQVDAEFESDKPSTSAAPNEDEFDAFAHFVAVQLRALSLAPCMKAQIKIMEALNEARIKDNQI